MFHGAGFAESGWAPRPTHHASPTLISKNAIRATMAQVKMRLKWRSGAIVIFVAVR